MGAVGETTLLSTLLSIAWTHYSSHFLSDGYFSEVQRKENVFICGFFYLVTKLHSHSGGQEAGL